jgi:hypothetical protein
MNILKKSLSHSIYIFSNVCIFTSAQKNKLSKGQAFQLSASQLQAGAGKHMVEIKLPSKDYEKLLINVSKN